MIPCCVANCKISVEVIFEAEHSRGRSNEYVYACHKHFREGRKLAKDLSSDVNYMTFTVHEKWQKID